MTALFTLQSLIFGATLLAMHPAGAHSFDQRAITGADLELRSIRSLIGPTPEPYTIPHDHDKGTNSELYYAPHSHPNLIKLVFYDTTSPWFSIKDVHQDLRVHLRGAQRGAELGGARVFASGLFQEHGRVGYYMEMEHLFFGDATLTYKGSFAQTASAAALLRVVHVATLSRTMHSALERRWVMADPDFIFNETSLRWLDTTDWRELDDFNFGEQMAPVREIVAWIDRVHPGYGQLLIRQLRTKISQSTIWSAAQKMDLNRHLTWATPLTGRADDTGEGTPCSFRMTTVHLPVKRFEDPNL